MPRRVKEPRIKFLFARLTPAEQALLQKAADANYPPLASWTRQTLLKAAQTVLGRLSAADPEG